MDDCRYFSLTSLLCGTYHINYTKNFLTNKCGRNPKFTALMIWHCWFHCQSLNHFPLFVEPSVVRSTNSFIPSSLDFTAF